MSWYGSNRRATLPENWPAIRQAVLDRDGRRCRAVLESTGHQCGQPATDVDHINRFGPQTDPSNLQSLCGWHHSRKSAAEGNAAKPPRESSNRPRPRHPGLL